MACFPMFMDLTGRECLLVGGGRVALRKIRTLSDFDAHITVISPEVCPELEQYAQERPEQIRVFRRYFAPEDCAGKALVVAATNDRDVNHGVFESCKARNIPVNTIDCREECTFLFPAYVKEQNVVAAFSGSGNSPLIAQMLKEQAKQYLLPVLGDLNERMGQLREEDFFRKLPESDRKTIYRMLYNRTLERGGVPDENEIQELMKNYAL